MFHVEPVIKDVLLQGLQSLGLSLPADYTDRLCRYFNMLIIKNEFVNLISPKQNLETKVIIHLLDSLSPLLWDKLPQKAHAMDLGSGGGLPALPLSIVRPNWIYSLVEATGKKVNFLDEVKTELQLNNIKLINGYLNPNSNRENVKYDLISARGVSSLDNLIPIIGPRLSSQGLFMAYKGPQADEELILAGNTMAKWKIELIDRLSFKLPMVNADRVLLFFRKTG